MPDPVDAPKVLVLIRSLHIGGAERQVTFLARSLQERGVPVAVGVFYRGGELEADLEERGIEIVDLAKRSRWDLVGPIRALRREVDQRRIDYVISYGNLPNLLSSELLLRGSRAKVAWGVRTSGGRYVIGEFGSLAGSFSYWLESRLSGLPDVIISNSHAGRDAAIARGFPAEKMAVVPNGIAGERFAFDPEARREVREYWGFGEEHLVIGVVARFVPFKGHDDFLRASVEVLERFPRVRLVCAGTRSPEYQAQLRELAEELGIGERIFWHIDPGSRLKGVYSGLDLLVSASREGEGLSNVVLESLAADLPLVVTTSGDSPWVVGGCGVVVPTAAPEILGREICNFLEEGLPDRSLGRGSRRVASEFPVSALGERYLSILRSRG